MKTTDHNGYTPDAHPCGGYRYHLCQYEDCPSHRGIDGWIARLITKIRTGKATP